MNAYDELITAIARFIHTNKVEPTGILVSDQFDAELCDASELRNWSFHPNTSNRKAFTDIPYAVVPRQVQRFRFVLGDQE